MVTNDAQRIPDFLIHQQRECAVTIVESSQPVRDAAKTVGAAADLRNGIVRRRTGIVGCQNRDDIDSRYNRLHVGG